MKIVKQSVELEFVTPNAAQFIERTGRTCYKSEEKITEGSADKFVKMVLERGHHSVIEHAYASFRVVCDRGVSHEFVRHRLMSFSQESTRYCNYSKDKFGGEVTVIEPPGLINFRRDAWLTAMSYAERVYLDMIEAGVSPQIARSILPNALKTELVATANFREWRHFVTLRTAPAAHPQMREVAGLIFGILLRECPVCFEDLQQAEVLPKQVSPAQPAAPRHDVQPDLGQEVGPTKGEPEAPGEVG